MKNRASGFHLLLVASFLQTSLKAEEGPDLRVHEWGTYTTLHTPNGFGLSWYQNTSGKESELPGFVHERSFVHGDEKAIKAAMRAVVNGEANRSLGCSNRWRRL